MKRKLSLRSLLSLVFGGLVLLAGLLTVAIVGIASGDAAYGDAIEEGAQAQRVLTERVGAELEKVERAAQLYSLLPPDLASRPANGAAIFSLIPIASVTSAPDGVPGGWSMLGTGPVYRAPGAPTLARIDLGELREMMDAFMQEGVAGIFLQGNRLLARTKSGGRIDQASNEELGRMFARPVPVEARIADAPTLQRMQRDYDEPVLFSSEALSTSGLDLRIGFATTPSSVGNALAQVVVASAVAGIVALLSVIAALYIAKRIASPIGGVRDALHDIAELDLEAVEPLPSMPARELEDIRAALDRAVASLAAFSRFVPKALVKRLLERGDGALRLAEERDVSVMFTDIVGFTTISAAMQPAEATAMLDRHFELVSAAVEAEGGTLDKFVGDGTVAYWGAPEPVDDHATRALRAAARIQRAHADVMAAGEIPYGLRLGVHSGPAIAGTVGTATRLDYTIIGDTVNVASRLEQLGREIDPDSTCCVLVSGDTRSASGHNDCEHVTSRALRGREGEVEVFRLPAV